MNSTTRRYPRSSLEAFGPDATEACAIEHHRNQTTYYATWIVRLIILVSIVGTIWSLT